MIRLGGNLQGSTDDPEEIADAHKAYGYSAAYCPEVTLAQPERIRQIRKAFAKQDVVIAEVGAWCNMVDADLAQRSSNQAYVIERLALAEEVGAFCCIDYIGSVLPNSKYGPHPYNLSTEGFELCVETVRTIIDAVKPKTAKFCLEFMQWVLPDSPEACLELIKAVDRPAFAAHLDPVNIIVSPRQYFNNGELIKRCFELLGPYIVSCHAKDIVLRDQLALHFDESIPGQGQLDYRTYLCELAKLPGEVPLMLEHLQTQEQYTQARDYLFSVGKENGLQFKS
ncbi:sugar phosphate isomerase/epimerase family protein [Paenibacillus agricola]|uniref:Sugar phosphate isomerase/epimerase n=1 Tax=Paenibacillus agricola TaxID=2716264 RepID=A0ABX0IYC6_9BACL|nr:sugar phosphate isomerase/epimerase [Paenibacillus agricola]NHN28972.1 sugar phosphate isomerase/epimerase [Paenibacillus agricola]